MCITNRLHRGLDSPRLKSLDRPGHETAVFKLCHSATFLSSRHRGVSGAPKSSTTTACWTSARASTVRGQTTCRYQDHHIAHGTKRSLSQNEIGFTRETGGVSTGPTNKTTLICRQSGNENDTPACCRKSRIKRSCPKTSPGTCRQSRPLMWPITSAKTACMEAFIYRMERIGQQGAEQGSSPTMYCSDTCRNASIGKHCCCSRDSPPRAR